MTFYPPKINEKFSRPRNVGKTAGANAVGTSANFVCGAFVRFYLRIEKETKEIVEAQFKTDGCGFTIAAAEVLTDKIKGEKLAGLHGLDKNLLKKEIESALGEFPAHRAHCSEISLDALRAAFADFRLVQIEEWSGEKALICTCFGVSEETVENLATEKSLSTVEEVIDACNAGGGCGSCQPLIQEILDDVRLGEI